MQRRYRSVQSSSELPAGDAIGTASSGLSNLTAGESVMLEAATQREALAAQWLSAAQVDARFSAPASGNGHCASELHRADHLLGVYVASPMPSYPYPPWQFRLDGRPVDQLTKILAVLRDFGPFPLGVNDLRRTTGWGGGRVVPLPSCAARCCHTCIYVGRQCGSCSTCRTCRVREQQPIQQAASPPAIARDHNRGVDASH